MSLLNWFSRKKPPADAESSMGLSRAEPSQPNAAPAGNRRGERTARREALYVVVRECMNRAGVLSSAYKFKVLSLDGWGRQFLVMVDLAGTKEESAERLADLEAMIGHAARARHDIVVKAVYWRQGKHVAITPPRNVPPKGEPKAAAAPVVQTAPAAPRAKADGTFEPINEQELAAFRSALAKGAKPAVEKPERSYTLLTGFENTELHEEPPVKLRSLSGSQYGDLN